MTLCECGCGKSPKAGRFLRGHNNWRSTLKHYPTALRSDGRCGRLHRIRAERALGRALPVAAEIHHVDAATDRASRLVICENAAYHDLLHIRTRIIAAGGNPNTDRICGKCKQVKPINAFRPYPRKVSGVAQRCKECERACCRAEYWRRKARAA